MDSLAYAIKMLFKNAMKNKTNNGDYRFYGISIRRLLEKSKWRRA